jgi:acyl-CoA synthetase (AMP-forming)/AMP-acid ligase II
VCAAQVFFKAEGSETAAQNACSGTHMLLWLPHFHDFCLTVGILGCGMKGYPIVLMSPLHFISKPTRWLDFMSRYKTSHTVGPDFAFGLLSRWVLPLLSQATRSSPSPPLLSWAHVIITAGA